MNIEINNFRPNAELNSIKPTTSVTEKSPVVEIFSAMSRGMDTSQYGAKVDRVNALIKDLAAKASKGDGISQVELNTITTYAIQAPLLKRLEILKFMGNMINVGYNEEIRYRVYKLEGKGSQIQASQGDAPFKTSSFKTRTLTTETVTGGMAVNYREKLTTGDYDGYGVLQEQTITDMYNKVFCAVLNSLYSGIRDATGIKHFVEASGISETAVKDMLKVIRRWGEVSIVGDYSVVSQLNSWGIETKAGATPFISEAAMNEIRRTGLISYFYGSPIIELPNTYDLTKLNATGDNYETYLPEGLLNFLVRGEMSPLVVGYKGGLTSISGMDVTTGTELTRFDLEFGTTMIDEYIPRVGLISDTNYSINA